MRKVYCSFSSHTLIASTFLSTSIICLRSQMELPLFLLISLFCFTTSHAFCNSVDHDSLLMLSSSISPELNWTSATDCCYWEGVSCNSNDRVTRLWLPSRGFRGSISPAITNLTALTHLNISHSSLYKTLPDEFFLILNRLSVVDLSYNRLSGKIPISLPPSIRILDLSSNSFSGAIPPSLFFQPTFSLISVNISHNSLTGLIPSSICSSCPSLSFLDFSFNDLDGEIPQDLKACSGLKVLRAGFNNLSGELPRSIYSSWTLQEIGFPGNSLSGEIDEAISNLTDLRILNLFGNRFRGSIPWGIGRLANLEQLQLHINAFNGTIPPSLMNCKNLKILNLRVNLLSGDLSSYNFSKLNQLMVIDLGNNNFTGFLPQSLFSCKSLTAVCMATNQLEGEVSADILRLQSLSFLSLSTNRLSNLRGALQVLMNLKNLSVLVLARNFYNETLPDIDVAGFQNLQVLGLDACKLSGQLPTWLGNLKKLRALELSQNRITGLIPGWIVNLPNLFYLDLSQNNLNGGIPDELKLGSNLGEDGGGIIYAELPIFIQPKDASNLQYNRLANLPRGLYLAENNLSGNIPPQIGRLKFLHVIDLSSNHFSGIIPITISDLTNLERLDLSSNHLSGEIPASLKNLHFLSFFSAANNNLKGPVPTGQFDTFPSTSFEGNVGLCGPVLQRPCNHLSPESAQKNTSTPGNDSEDEFVLKLLIGGGFGVGFAISVLALWISISGRKLLNRVVAWCCQVFQLC